VGPGDLLAARSDRLTGHLELRAGLAGGRNRRNLAAALVELAPPGAVQLEITVAVELIDQRERRNHTIGVAVIGRKHLDTGEVLQVLDAPVALLALEKLP
jgi:hypothetical protein